MTKERGAVWTNGRLASLATFGLLAAAILGCDAPSRPRAAPASIVFISLDTFRADLLDRLGPDGRPVVPNLARLAADSLKFDSAYAGMAYTLPSHATMFSGLHHDTHYVVTEKHRLSEKFPVIGEFLAPAGWKGAGIFTSHFLRADFGYSRGFDVWRELPVDLTYASRVNRAALEELDLAASAKQRLLLFLHYYDAHSDFDLQENRLAYYSLPGSRTQFTLASSELCDDQRRCATEYLIEADRDRRQVTPDDLAVLRAQYESGARELDAALGQLFEELRRRGLWRDTLLIVTADHGEEFREHGMFLHSQVYSETLRVPLLVHWPAAVAPGSVGRLVGLESIAPTLLGAIGVARPTGMQGADLLGELGDLEADVFEISQDKLKRSRYGARNSRYLLTWDFSTQVAELFDRAADGAERNDLAAERAEVAEELRHQLFAGLRRLRSSRIEIQGVAGASPFSPVEVEVLRSLGYL